MIYENKIAIVLIRDLKEWQKLNVASFLASSIAIQFPETHGKEFVNASGSTYLPFLKHPIMIYAANSSDEIMRDSNEQKKGICLLEFILYHYFLQNVNKKT